MFDECKRAIIKKWQRRNVLYEIEQDSEDKKLKWGSFAPAIVLRYTIPVILS